MGFLSGPHLEGRVASSRPGSCEKPAPAEGQLPEGASAGVDDAKDRDSAATSPRWAQLQKAALKLPQETKDCPCTEGLKQPAGNAETSLGLSRDLLLSAAPKGSRGQGPCHTEGLHSASAQQPRGSAPASGAAKELEAAALPLQGRAEAKQGWITRSSKAARGESCTLEAQDTDAARLQEQQDAEQEPRAGPASPEGHREEEQQQQRVTEATVCAKNSKVSSTGEKVVLWTRYCCLSCIFLCSLFASSSHWVLSFHFASPFCAPSLGTLLSPSVWPHELHWLLLVLVHLGLGKNLYSLFPFLPFFPFLPSLLSLKKLKFFFLKFQKP